MKKTLVGLIIFVKWGLLIMAILSFVGIAFFDGAGTPFYRVKEKYGRVITQFDGTRYANTKVGIHYRFTSLNPKKWVFNTEECSLRSEFFNLDNDPTPHEMQAFDKIKFKGSGVFRYRKTDLYKFGVTMGKNIQDAEEMLMKELNSMAKDVIQAHTVEENVTQMKTISKKVMNSEEKSRLESEYGIKIEAFKMTDATYPNEMNEKTAEAKLLKIMGKATKSAAEDFKEATKIRAEANEYHLQKLIAGSGVKTEEGRQKALETLRNLNLYDMLANRQQKGSIIVLPHGSNPPNLTLPRQTTFGP